MDFHFPSSHQFFSAIGNMLDIIVNNNESKNLTDVPSRLRRDENVQYHLLKIVSQGYQPGAELFLNGFLQQIALLLDQAHQIQLTSTLEKHQFNEALLYFFFLPYIDNVIYSLSYFEVKNKNTITLHTIRNILSDIIKEPTKPIQIYLNRHLKKIIPRNTGRHLKSDTDAWRTASEYTPSKINKSNYIDEIILEMEKNSHISAEEVRLSYRALQYAGLFVREFYKKNHKSSGKKFTASANVLNLCRNKTTNSLMEKIVPDLKYVPYDEKHTPSITFGLLSMVSGRNEIEKLKTFLPQRYILNEEYLDDIVSNFCLYTSLKSYTPLVQAGQSYMQFFVDTFTLWSSDLTSPDEITELINYCCNGNSPTAHSMVEQRCHEAIARLKKFVLKKYGLKVTSSKDYVSVIDFLHDVEKKTRLATILNVIVLGLLNIAKEKTSPGHYLPLVKRLPADYKHNVNFSYIQTVFGLQDNSISTSSNSHLFRETDISITIPYKHMALTHGLKEFNYLFRQYGLFYAPFEDKLELVESLYSQIQPIIYNEDWQSRDKVIASHLQLIQKNYDCAVFGFIDIDLYDLIFKCEEYLRIFYIESNIKIWVSDIRFRKIVLNIISSERFAFDAALAELRQPAIYIGPPSIRVIPVNRQFIP
jgi:hypothetical protein